jgi:hypothetical protein
MFPLRFSCRRGEAAHLEWPHLDVETAEWRQPGRLTTNRDPHRLHRHPLMLDLLKTRNRSAAELGRHPNAVVFLAPEG